MKNKTTRREHRYVEGVCEDCVNEYIKKHPILGKNGKKRLLTKEDYKEIQIKMDRDSKNLERLKKFYSIIK